MKYHGPSVQQGFLRVDHVSQQIQRILVAGVTGTPAENARKIVPCSQRHDRASRRGTFAVLSNVVQTLQHPSYRSVTAANQDFVILYVTEYVETATEPSPLSPFIFIEMNFEESQVSLKYTVSQFIFDFNSTEESLQFLRMCVSQTDIFSDDCNLFLCVPR